MVNQQNTLSGKLKAYDIINTPAEQTFDQITRLAAGIFNVPFGFMIFPDGEGTFFKSQTGNNADVYDIQFRDVLDAPSFSSQVKFLINHKNSSQNIIAAPITDGEMKILGFLGVQVLQNEFEDREILMLKDLAALAKDKLERRLQTRSLLKLTDDRLHVLIHDLKNSMTTISLQSELLEKLAVDPDRTKLIAGRINNQAKNITEAFNHILTSAKRENHNYKPNKTKLNLGEVLTKTIQFVTPLSASKTQKIWTNIPLNIELFADEEKLIQVFTQVIDNAVKFSQTGAEIRIEAELVEHSVVVSIADTGVGLHADDIDRLFLKFADLTSKPTAQENSDKLGLQIVKLLVDIHKGKLWVESKGPNLGTTFYIQLPLK